MSQNRICHAWQHGKSGFYSQRFSYKLISPWHHVRHTPFAPPLEDSYAPRISHDARESERTNFSLYKPLRNKTRYFFLFPSIRISNMSSRDFRVRVTWYSIPMECKAFPLVRWKGSKGDHACGKQVSRLFDLFSAETRNKFLIRHKRTQKDFFFLFEFTTGKKLTVDSNFWQFP
jgi:hypothetical protein